MSNLPRTIEKAIALDKSKRLIGSVRGSDKGPVIIALAGIHGNERAGVEALEQVFGMIHSLDTPFKGDFWGLRVNLPALKQGVRYVDEDMNRIWFPSIIQDIRETPAEELDSSERKEVKKLLPLLERLISSGRPEYPTIIVDLHSFSAEGCMFIISPRKKDHIRLLSHLHAPMIFGIENTLKGTALRYYQDLGHITFAFEGGQHQNELTVYNNIAALFLLLNRVGCIPANAVSRIREFEQHLSDHTQNVPSRVELVYQHIIEPNDDFEMRPGFKNFDPIKKGEWLANDNHGKIRAQCDGFLVMPLYQNQGDDGFFIVREQHS